ncbi:MAG TPA: acetyl-CoA carboxylase biotin carboxyl carrier protein [Bryobacteraceae bacterium]|nr:acetyl-CoA carboxylase biotin carboxyl carrier protein [Bryobacteraceae bacterium]
MTIDEIKKLIDLVRETGIAELEVQLGNDRVRIRSMAPAKQEVVLPTVMPVSLATATGQSLTAVIPPAAPESAPSPAAPAAAEQDVDNLVVKSPIVGTYYDAPSPGAAPFVKIGDRVEPKQILCIIESMKLMNEIEAEVAGVVVAKHVENGRPIEYGESLFTLRPL